MPTLPLGFPPFFGGLILSYLRIQFRFWHLAQPVKQGFKGFFTLKVRSSFAFFLTLKKLFWEFCQATWVVGLYLRWKSRLLLGQSNGIHPSKYRD